MKNESKEILESWEANAKQWINTIDGAEIESRTVATNEAIVNIIASYAPKNILDIGCGEGWLTRTLAEKRIQTYGVDGVAQLIENAKEKGGDYFCYTYEEIVNGNHNLPFPFDTIVINFALIDKDNTEGLLQYLPQLLKKDGLVFIQTLHPLNIIKTGEYNSGWKEGSWQGMKQPFVKPYNWYFRTMEDWMEIFNQSGFKLLHLKEPFHPQTKQPLSIIFVLQVDKSSL